MKQFKIINAYNNTEFLAKNDKLSEQELWDVFQLRKALLPHVEYQNEREEALKEKYADKIVDGKLSGEPMENFIKDLTEINQLEKEVDIPKIQIHLREGFTVLQMEALEDFVEFVRG